MVLNNLSSRTQTSNQKADKQLVQEPFAEIIESSLAMAQAQSWQWNTFPRFGSLMQINQQETTILGLVTSISTGSMDPIRYPFPYQKTEKELMLEQPQIFEFLKTTFTMQIIGFLSNDIIAYRIPPYPSKIHSFVQEASYPLIASFFKKTDFLFSLFSFSSHVESVDELLIACLAELAMHKLLTPTFLDSFSHSFSLLTGNDYRRLKLFLHRVEKVTSSSLV